MRKVICMLVAVVSLALFSGQAYAQRYLPGMKAVELRGGFAEGSKSPLNHYAGFAVSGYTQKANRWVVGAEYLLKNYGYRNVSVSARAIHRRGRLLPEIPVRPIQDTFPFHRRIGFGRLRNRELGQ